MWNSEYPGSGQQHHHHHHHHQQQGEYGAPPGPPPGGFPQVPQGFAPPGYGPPPPGYGAPPPGSYGGYAPPQGPPPPQDQRYRAYEQRGYPPPAGPPDSYGSGPYGPPATGGYGGYNDYQAAVPPPPGNPHAPPSEMQNYNQGGPETQFFQYSQCTGKKKALCIGINYIGSSNALGGCINDAHNVRRFLEANFGYRTEDIVMLTDDARNERQQPTVQNIRDAMRWLVADAQPNDSLFFHYSGHGGQAKDQDGDEEDGYDEVIYPVDFETNGPLTDDELHFTMVSPLPPGCRLTSIFDSCHSGSVLDLPYIYSTEGKIKEPNLGLELGKGALSAFSAYAKKDYGGLLKDVMGLAKIATGQQNKAQEITRRTRTSPADAISWSGCKDSQTSADTSEGGQAVGAMSYAFIESCNEIPPEQRTYKMLLDVIRSKLKARYSQKPQLSASHPIDTNIIFIA